VSDLISTDKEDLPKEENEEEKAVENTQEFSVPKDATPDNIEKIEPVPDPEKIKPVKKGKIPITYPIIGGLLIIILAFIFLKGFEKPQNITKK